MNHVSLVIRVGVTALVGTRLAVDRSRIAPPIGLREMRTIWRRKLNSFSYLNSAAAERIKGKTSQARYLRTSSARKGLLQEKPRPSVS
jgi:hypothetical protein